MTKEQESIIYDLNELAEVALKHKLDQETVRKAATIITQQSEQIERLQKRFDWLQKLYAEDLKRNPDVPFGMLAIPLDRNYGDLGNAIDAELQNQKRKGE